MRCRVLLIAFALAAESCSRATPWDLDSIATGESRFDSSRLTYSTPSSHLKLEFLKVDGQVQAFCYLNQYAFSPAVQDPSKTPVTITIDGIAFAELAPLREGKMRVRLSDEMSARLIFALQEGKKVGILLSGLSEVVAPDSFADQYQRFWQGQGVFSNLLKGPLE